MTKTVEQLASEAGIDIHNDTLCRHEGWELPMHRFASLVAEECAQQCQAMKTVSGIDDLERGYNAALRRAAFEIREIFQMPDSSGF